MSGVFAIRQEMNGVAEAPDKTWFWELASGVIDADRCIRCGTCVAVCPSDSIGVGGDGLPALVKMCTGCSLCWDFCPRGGLRYETTWIEPGSHPAAPPGARPAGTPGDLDFPVRISGGGAGDGLGALRESWAARSAGGALGGPRVQDGGVVTALLVAALEAGDIDGALVARASATEAWKGVPYLARTPDEVRECGGSFYNQTMALGHLDLSGYDLPAHPRLAVVGTPCEVQGIRAMQAYPWPRGSHRVEAVVLTIALACTKSFDYEALMLDEIARRRGVDLDEVGKLDVVRGQLVVWDREGSELVREPVKAFHGAALKGCDECADFLGRGADLTVGNVGSPDGWSSVLVRTAAGAEAFARASDRLEVGPLPDPAALARLDAHDRKVAVRSLRRELDPDGAPWITYTEHVGAYEGSDRAPVG